MFNDTIEMNYQQQPALQQFTKPLFDLLSIKQFLCYHIEADHITLLNSHLAHFEHYIEHKLYECDPHVTLSNHIKPGKTLWSEFDDVFFQGKWLYQLKTFFKLGNGITITEKVDKGFIHLGLSGWSMHHNLSECVL